MAHGGRRHNDDSVWAPLADVMSLVACVFLAIFVIALGAYLKAATENRRKDEQLKKMGRAANSLIPGLVGAWTIFRDAAKNGPKGTSPGQSAMTTGSDHQLQIDDGLLFPTGSAELSNTGRKLVRDVIAKVVADALDHLKNKPYHRILIAGHTDGDPVTTVPRECLIGPALDKAKLAQRLEHPQDDKQKWFQKEAMHIAEQKPSGDADASTLGKERKRVCYRYLDNWELSAARALTVLREILKAQPRLDQSRIYAAGFAETQLIDKANPTSEKNRRVEISVQTDIVMMLQDEKLMPTDLGESR